MTQRFADDPQSIPGGRIIAKAIVKTYTAGTHKADVQLVGSHPTVLSAIRVATDIPAADVVAGRQCTVLFLDPANQDDAVILTIQGALPSGGGGGVTSPPALTSLDYASAGHTGFETPTGAQAKVDTHAAAADPHTVYGALAQAETWAALQTFGAGLRLSSGQAIQNSAGVDRIRLAITSQHITLIGDANVDGNLKVGTGPFGNFAAYNTNPSTGIVNIGGNTVFTPATASVTGLQCQVVAAPTSGAPNVIAVAGFAKISGGSGATISNLIGLQYYAQAGGALPHTNVKCIEAKVQVASFTGTLTSAMGIDIPAPQIVGGTPTVTTMYGLRVNDQGHSSIGTVYGVYIANITAGTTRRLLEVLGLTGPNLRVEAGDPTSPGASKGRSQVLLDFNENGTVTLRRVEWIDSGAAGGAGIPANAKLLIAV